MCTLTLADGRRGSLIEVVLDLPSPVHCLWLDESVALMGAQRPNAMCIYNWEPQHPRDACMVRHLR